MRGKPVAQVVSDRQFRRLCRTGQISSQLMRRSPLVRIDVGLQRGHRRFPSSSSRMARALRDGAGVGIGSQGGRNRKRYDYGTRKNPAAISSNWRRQAQS
ncbi:MAG: hypothetical protein HYZ28_27665 [Myxococcales bacterium]|nr:hypothetical protein [Myxococcales bacterium]